MDVNIKDCWVSPGIEPNVFEIDSTSGTVVTVGDSIRLAATAYRIASVRPLNDPARPNECDYVKGEALAVTPVWSSSHSGYAVARATGWVVGLRAGTVGITVTAPKVNSAYVDVQVLP